MSADQITTNLIAGIAGAPAGPTDIVTRVLVEETAGVVVGTVLPATVPANPGLSFGLTMEPDAITQMIGETL